MATNAIIENLKVVSYNMHGFMQGFSVLEDFTKTDNKPDVFLLQEHWLAPANLDRFDKYFPDYFSFGCSAMAVSIRSLSLRIPYYFKRVRFQAALCQLLLNEYGMVWLC